MGFDISFCSNEGCSRKDCRRHLVHLDNAPKEGLYSMCTFNEQENTDDCDWYWEGGKK